VAVEIARQLQALGEPMGLLVLVDSQIPTWKRIVLNRLRNIWRNSVLPFLRRCRASWTERRAALREAYHIFFSPSEEQRVGRRQVQIGRRYIHRLLRHNPPPYYGPATLIVCEKRREIDPAKEWRELIKGALTIHYVPGDHLSHLREHAPVTAARINACLEAAQVQHKAA
jgi:thioesterase domain-containing protein